MSTDDRYTDDFHWSWLSYELHTTYNGFVCRYVNCYLEFGWFLQPHVT